MPWLKKIPSRETLLVSALAMREVIPFFPCALHTSHVRTKEIEEGLEAPVQSGCQEGLWHQKGLSPQET